MAQHDPLKHLGVLLRNARREAGLTIRQLEAQSGVSRPMIARLENGQYRPQPMVLIKLAQTLELPSAALFDIAGIPVPTERASLPAMLRSDYDLPPEAIAEVQRNIERIARKYRSQGATKNVSKERRTI